MKALWPRRFGHPFFVRICRGPLGGLKALSCLLSDDKINAMSIARSFALTLLLSGSLLASPALAERRGDQISLSLDALGQGVYSNYFFGSNPVIGAGGSAFIDWRPVHVVSFGVGGQFATFFQTPSFQLTTFDLGGRIFPAPAMASGEFYLEGGVGLNLQSSPGHFHGWSGLGWRQFLDKSMALDLGAQYDFFSPIGQPVHGASAKVGLTFLFGRNDWTEPAGGSRIRARNMMIGGIWNGPSSYVLKPGESLRTVAYKVYGDEGLYPLLVDANKNQFLKVGFRQGTSLKVPNPPLTEEGFEQIEDRAFNDVDYLKWEERSEGGVTQAHNPSVRTYRWRKGDDLLTVAAQVYGDEDLYPLLVDANEDRIILPDNLVPGKTLKVPALPAEDQMEDLRLKSHDDPHYLWWRNITLERGEASRAPSNLESPDDSDAPGGNQ